MPSQFTLAAALFFAATLPASAEKVVYQGTDVEKLKCAVMYSVMGEFGLRSGEIKAGEYLMITGAVVTLTEDLPGTPAQKNQAMDAMGKRLVDKKSPKDIAKEFDRTLPRCEKFF